MQADSTPNPPRETPSLALAVRPFAFEDYHDLARDKHFVTLHYRRESTSRATALALIAQVLDDLAGSGVSLTDSLKITVARKNVPESDPGKTTAGDRYSVHVSAAVGRFPDAAGFPDEIRAHLTRSFVAAPSVPAGEGATK